MATELPVSLFVVSAFVIGGLWVIYIKSFFPMMRHLKQRHPKVHGNIVRNPQYNAIVMYRILFTNKLALDQTLRRYIRNIRLLFMFAFLYAIAFVVYAAILQ